MPYTHHLLLKLLNKSLDSVNSALGATSLGDEDLALLADNKDAALSAAGALLQANGGNERLLGVTEKRVLELLLVLEGGVGLGRIRAEAVDEEAVGSERLVGIAEEADLLGACFQLAYAVFEQL